MAWYSAEVLFDAMFLAGLMFVISTEPVAERLRVYALIARIVNTSCALLVVAYLSLWKVAPLADAAPFRRRLRLVLQIALLGPAAITLVLAAGHDLWIPLLLRGQPHEWGIGPALLLLALLASRTFLNLNSVRAKIAGAQPLVTSLSLFNLGAGVLLVAFLHPRVYSVLMIHAALLLAATGVVYRAVGPRLHEHRDLQSAA